MLHCRKRLRVHWEQGKYVSMNQSRWSRPSSLLPRTPKPGYMTVTRYNFRISKYGMGRLLGRATMDNESAVSVWIALSFMGNHCLCIEPAESRLRRPSRTCSTGRLRQGTPFTLGAKATVACSRAPVKRRSGTICTCSVETLSGRLPGPASGSRPALERLKSAARPNRGARAGTCTRLSLCGLSGPLDTQLEEIENKLDRAVGGRVLMRSIQRTATTFEEWVRYPPAQRAARRDRKYALASVSEMGLGGDWVHPHRGDHRLRHRHRPGLAQRCLLRGCPFANSWSPRLPLWSRRLRIVSPGPESDRDHESKYAKTQHKDVAYRAQDCGRSNTEFVSI